MHQNCEDLESHIDFEGWQFVSRGAMAYEECDPSRPIVCFGSFQVFLGVDRATDAIKPRNEWVHLEHWDLVAFDEYHFGAWRDSAQKLFAKPADEDDVVESAEKEMNAADILDIAMAGTSATLLARRWESTLLVNVDNDTLHRLLENDEAMRALQTAVVLLSRPRAFPKRSRGGPSFPASLTAPPSPPL